MFPLAIFLLDYYLLQLQNGVKEGFDAKNLPGKGTCTLEMQGEIGSCTMHAVCRLGNMYCSASILQYRNNVVS